MRHIHKFHIPVMGTGFSIDSPIKVAKYGISTVISLVDDTLIEAMRKFYCRVAGETYTPINKNDEDCRARRITEYLNLVDRIVKKQFAELKSSPFTPDSEITKYFELLPNDSPLKKSYAEMQKTTDPDKKSELQQQLRKQIKPGAIDVNIMTKLDRTNYTKDGSELPAEFSDALSALRGYAKSTLASAIVFSAGINRRLYSYAENFKDFFADKTGTIKKQIILKVSDYRSAITQGKFFAKKGLWVSEYRVESGLNCGGHLFASAGYLMGPILEEFRTRKKELITTLHKAYSHARELKKMVPFKKPHEVRITAQGGVGTVEEDKFLRNHYGVDATGWATPFLLVPEVTNVDEPTLQKLRDAKEDDIYPSDVSPMNIPFNNLRGSLSDEEQKNRAQKGCPGSACVKTHLAFNTEFTERPICTASRQYQRRKLEQLKTRGLSEEEYKKAYDEVVVKTCICNDLGESAIIAAHMTNGKKLFPAICPGPNLAHFSRIATLKEIVNHIYGRMTLINGRYRPHMFITELSMYIDYLKGEVKKCVGNPNEKQIQHFAEFRENLTDGIEYYKTLFSQVFGGAEERRKRILEELLSLKENLDNFIAANRYAFEPSQQAKSTAA